MPDSASSSSTSSSSLQPPAGAELAGRRVLVTGASGGIGAAVVERLAREGAWVAIHHGRDVDGARALLERIGGAGALVQADLSRPGAAGALWQAALAAAGGRLHALVNNAGVRGTVTVDDTPEAWQAAWQRDFQINFFAAADLSREAIVHFRAHGGGRLVHMASRAAQRGYAADALPYGCSKAALINLSKSIARSFGGQGIESVAIAPGWVETDMVRDYIATHGAAAVLQDIPIGATAAPAEVAELVAFVLRPGQRSLNGATLDVNGGSHIR
ncbi:SDR family NAD(P)-dependent oxidoreductase [Pseudaquabacterium rugosum]|uniref:SDR family oxidoreductase n=1 Tax=Pseudaquabacterium rugosum TaxID=2984194 RepID=A0ABU9BA67_9BURK